MSQQQQTSNTALIVGNFLMLIAILVLVVGTAYYYSTGIGLSQAYISILGNPLGAAAFAATIYAGAIVPLADQARDRQDRLRRLSNRSLATIFMESIAIIPALTLLPTMNIFLALGAASIITAFASSMFQLTPTAKAGVLTTTFEVLGSLLIVFAAVVQIFVVQAFPEQLPRHHWAISAAVIVAGIVLVLASRRGAKAPVSPTPR